MATTLLMMSFLWSSAKASMLSDCFCSATQYKYNMTLRPAATPSMMYSSQVMSRSGGIPAKARIRLDTSKTAVHVGNVAADRHHMAGGSGEYHILRWRSPVASPVYKLFPDSCMTASVAKDMMTAQAITATVCSLVLPTGYLGSTLPTCQSARANTAWEAISTIESAALARTEYD